MELNGTFTAQSHSSSSLSSSALFPNDKLKRNRFGKPKWRFKITWNTGRWTFWPFLKWILCDSLHLMTHLSELHNPGTATREISVLVSRRWGGGLSTLAVGPEKPDLRQQQSQHTRPKWFGSHAEKHSTRFPLSWDVSKLKRSCQEGAMMADANTGTTGGAGGSSS